MNTLTNLWKDEGGFILSAELVLILTIGCIGMIVGLNSVATSVTNELNDLSSALGALDQSYAYNGLRKSGHAWVVGSGFADGADFCDCSIITQTHALIHGNSSGYSEASGYASAGGYSYAGAASSVAVANSAAVAVSGAYAFGAGGCYAFAADGTLVVVLADGRIINVSAAGVIIRVHADGLVLDALGHAYAGTCYGIAENGSVYVLTIVDGKVSNLLARGIVIAKILNDQLLIGGYAVAVNGTLVRVLSTGVVLNIRLDGTIILVTTDGKISTEAGVIIENPGTIYSITSTGSVNVFTINQQIPVVNPPAVDDCDEDEKGDCKEEKKTEKKVKKVDSSKEALKPVPQKKDSSK